MNALPSLTALCAKALADGGLSARFSDGSAPRNGFATSVQAYERRVRDLSPSAIGDYLAWVAPILPAAMAVFGDELCLGVWYNAGEWYLDLSIVCRSLDAALTLARANNQLAVYDVGGCESIAVPYARVA